MKSSALFISACLIALAIGSVLADEVQLKNGDRITGEIKTLIDGKLILITSYAGEITIDWTQVVEIRTDKAITVLLISGDRLQGVVEPAENGELKVKTDLVKGDLFFNLSNVKAINFQEAPPIKWTARANIGVKVEGGNTDSEDYHIDGLLQSSSGVHRFTMGLEEDREFTSGVITENRWLFYTKYDHFLDKKWYLSTGASFEKDDFKAINSRAVLGVGGGYQVWKSVQKNLSTELGFSYVSESFSGVTKNRDYSSLRWASDFDWYIYKKVIQLFHWNEIFANFQDSQDYWLRTRTGLRFPIYRGLTWTAQYTWDFDNIPAEGQKKNDTTFQFTLGYQIKN